MEQRVPMTPQGQLKLQKKLKNLKQVERPRNVAAIETARDHGDLSENADYDAAKERQQQISRQIQEIEHSLSLAQVIDPATIESEKVVFGATVTLSDVESGDEVTYMIVGTAEADVTEGKISIESPIARALIGREEGDEVRVKTPKGVRLYELIGLEYR